MSLLHKRWIFWAACSLWCQVFKGNLEKAKSQALWSTNCKQTCIGVQPFITWLDRWCKKEESTCCFAASSTEIDAHYHGMSVYLALLPPSGGEIRLTCEPGPMVKETTSFGFVVGKWCFLVSTSHRTNPCPVFGMNLPPCRMRLEKRKEEFRFFEGDFNARALIWGIPQLDSRGFWIWLPGHDLFS